MVRLSLGRVATTPAARIDKVVPEGKASTSGIAFGVVPRTLAVLAVLLTHAGCMPYVMGSTAQPVPAGSEVSTIAAYYVPKVDIDINSDGPEPYAEVHLERRFGLNDKSDIGVRIMFPLATAIASYKRRLHGISHPDSAALSAVFGLGVIDVQAGASAGLQFSGRKHGAVTPYGGVQVIYTTPFSSKVRRSQPALGVNLGAMLGSGEEVFLPELALYYDSPGLERGGPRRLLLVPALTYSRRINFPGRIR